MAALILIHTAFQLGFCTFVLRNFMRTVPFEIIDAARVDGCGEFRIYWQIVLPLTLPALAALATLEFTWVFNDYLWAHHPAALGCAAPGDRRTGDPARPVQ